MPVCNFLNKPNITISPTQLSHIKETTPSDTKLPPLKVFTIQKKWGGCNDMHFLDKVPELWKIILFARYYTLINISSLCYALPIAQLFKTHWWYWYHGFGVFCFRFPHDQTIQTAWGNFSASLFLLLGLITTQKLLGKGESALYRTFLLWGSESAGWLQHDTVVLQAIFQLFFWHSSSGKLYCLGIMGINVWDEMSIFFTFLFLSAHFFHSSLQIEPHHLRNSCIHIPNILSMFFLVLPGLELQHGRIWNPQVCVLPLQEVRKGEISNCS